jgi:putative transcriptional regulator
MSFVASHQPSEELVEDFFRGNLSAGLSVAVSAHLEMCGDYAAASRRVESSIGDDWGAGPETPRTLDISAAFEKITMQPQASVHDILEKRNRPTEMHMLERSIKLPKVLAKVASKGLVWKNLAAGISSALLKLDDQTQCEFLYIKPGARVPLHRHQGNEFTLVLDGSFHDSAGEYQPADFLARNGDHQHQPASEEGCLCFSVLDSPLKFTSGLARLFNPLNKYRFRRATS